MITDRTLLKIFLQKKVYDKYSHYVKYDALQDETKTILKDLGKYLEEFDVDEVDLDKFITYFNQVRHPDLSESKCKLYNFIFNKIKDEEINEDDDFYKSVLNYFKSKEYIDKIRASVDKGLDTEVLRELIVRYESEVKQAEEGDFVENTFENIFVKTTRDVGLRWRLNALNQSIGPVIKGDFGYVAAYVDTGKTKFLCSEAAFMAQQITDGSVLYFNNEGPEDRIQAQVWCAALGASKDLITANPEKALAKYEERMNGDVNRVKFFDAVDFSPQKIREKAEKYNAKLIIIDMLDHLKFGGKDQAEVIRLKNLYKEIRMISKEFCPILGATQCDGSVTWKNSQTQEAQFQRYIGMHQLDYSRSAKQAAAEFIITLGRDPNYPNSRYVHVPKNKLDGDGNELNRNIKAEVTFDGSKSIFSD